MKNYTSDKFYPCGNYECPLAPMKNLSDIPDNDVIKIVHEKRRAQKKCRARHRVGYLIGQVTDDWDVYDSVQPEDVLWAR